MTFFVEKLKWPEFQIESLFIQKKLTSAFQKTKTIKSFNKCIKYSDLNTQEQPNKQNSLKNCVKYKSN